MHTALNAKRRATKALRFALGLMLLPPWQQHQTARQIWMKTQFSQHDHLHHEYRRAGDAGDGEQAFAAPCQIQCGEEGDP